MWRLVTFNLKVADVTILWYHVSLNRVFKSFNRCVIFDIWQEPRGNNKLTQSRHQTKRNNKCVHNKSVLPATTDVNNGELQNV